MSEAELAERVRAWLVQNGHHDVNCEALHIRRYESGETVMPHTLIRQALRCVLRKQTDADLGFPQRPRHGPGRADAKASTLAAAPAELGAGHDALPVWEPGRASSQHGRCPRCGCTLRQDQTLPSCDPCSKEPDIIQYLLPDDFYDRLDVAAALAKQDFGFVFRKLLEEVPTLGQEGLARATGLQQGRISQVVNGRSRLTGAGLIVQVVNRLGIAPWRLGLHGPAGNQPGVPDGAGFFSTLLATTAGLDAVTGGSGAPRMPSRSRRHGRIGLADVQLIETTTAELRRDSCAEGGARWRAHAETTLSEALTLPGMPCADTLRGRLHIAIADLAHLTASLSFDCERYDEAWQQWLVAGGLAEYSAHPRRHDLLVHILLSMAHHHLHQVDIGARGADLNQALSLVVEARDMAAAQPAHAIGSRTRGYVDASLAWCYAAAGQLELGEHMAKEALASYAEADDVPIPPWATFLGTAEVSAQHGHVHVLLSRTHPDHAYQAIEHLTAAVHEYGSEYALSAAVHLPRLAAAHVQVGDFDTAITTGQAAVLAAEALSSRRAASQLIVLDAAVTAHHHRPGISALRHNIAATVHAIRAAVPDSQPAGGSRT